MMRCSDRQTKFLNKSDGVILDATFVTQSLRKRAAEIAARHNRHLSFNRPTASRGLNQADTGKD